MLPGFFTGGKILLRLLRGARLSRLGLFPAKVDFPPGIRLPDILLLKQPQRFANHFIDRLEITSGYFAPDKIFERHWQAHVHNSMGDHFSF
jgi:hypothetical protein